MQRVTVFGPNLRDQSRGQFQVHDADCSDGSKVKGLPGEPERWSFDAHSLADIAAAVYGDFLSEGSMTTQDALDDIHFAPCVRLPKEEDQ